ncbi:MAG: hypothetical protein JWN44_1568 [Myxococcales bacterium]|nr:hypothetical protein [Myxococcales bacterium]
MRAGWIVWCLALGSLVAAEAHAAPTLAAGMLSPPSRAPVESIAAGYLERSGVAAARLMRAEVAPVGDGTVVRYRQQHAGLPVIGGSVVLRIDGRGQVRRVASSMFDLGAIDVTPSVTMPAAVAAARARGAFGAGAGQSVLAIAPGAAGAARLVWAVRLPPTPQLLENAIYFVDAHDGRVLKRLDLIKYAGMARVFQKNPTEAGNATVTVPFPDLFTPTGATLTSPLLQGYDCVDEGEKKMINMGGFTADVHICTVRQKATAANQDYTAYLPQTEPATAPNNGCPGVSAQPADEFSEQHMYWHVANTYAFFRTLFGALGNGDFKLRITAQDGKPLPVAVNLCTINLSTLDFAGPLLPFDNAFFSPGAGNPISDLLIGGLDSIMFGQGSVADFAYDADVISHEFTHAVIDTLGRLNPAGFEDTQGLTDDPGAMNEGLADYFSSAMGGDPLVGEYGGKNIPGNGAAEGAVRNLDNKDLCADDRWGEVHQDSQAFSASLWAARVAIAGDPKAAGFDAARAKSFDVAVLAALQSFPDQVDMPMAAAAIAAETEMKIDAAARKKVEDAFAAHKLSPKCDRVITWTGTNKKSVLFLDGTGSANAPMGANRVPGYVQWKVDVPADSDSITVSATLQSQGGAFGGGAAAALELVVGPAGQPITWMVNGDVGNEVKSAPFSGASGAVTAKLAGLTAGPQYVMIVNAGGSVIGRNISFATDCSLGPGLCIPPDMAMGGGGNKGGCNCGVGGRAPVGGLYAMLGALLALALVTRAARRRWR